jgi:23S rRNA (uracil1939-C5)-methyltransferase
MNKAGEIMKEKELPISKNAYIEVEIIDLTHDGQGVAKVNQFPIFIKGVLPNELVKIKIILVKKNFAVGRLIEIIKESPNRVTPKCSIYKECGGCNIQHLDYKEQLQTKTKLVKETIKRIGELEPIIHDCLGMDEPWKYRNKTQVPFGVNEMDDIVAGFYKENTHEIINMDECDIQDQTTDEIINYIKTLVKRYYIAPYNEQTHSGTLRHVIVRYGYVTREYMVTLVTNDERIPNIKPLIEDLVNEYKMIKSVIQNINNKRTNTIMGDKTKVLYGDQYIHDYIGDVKYSISSRSFFQVNPIQTKVLYDKVVEYAGLNGNEIIIDAYCGIGTIGLYVAKRASKIYGVEVIPEAINDAIMNAKLNQFDHAHYEVGQAEDVIRKWQEQNIKADVIIIDPPRKGCDIKLLETIIEMNIPKIVYVSCDPSTLARDLKILKDDYQILEVQPVDMFPHTMHVETIVLMSRK